MNKPSNAPITDSDLVQKYFEIKDQLDTIVAEHKKAIEPIQAKLELIKNAFLDRLNTRGAKNTKTEFGTVYKVTMMVPKVVDRNTYLKFCLSPEHFEKWGSDMLRVSAVTEHVKAYVEQNDKHEFPPGVTGTSIIQVNIRRNTP